MKKLVLHFLLLTGYQLQAAESHALQAEHHIEHATAQTMTRFTGSRVTIKRQVIEGRNYFVIQFQGTHKAIVLSEYSVQQCQALDILFADDFDQLSISEAPEDTIYSFDCTPEGVQLFVDLFSDAPTIDKVEETLGSYTLDQLVDLFMAVTALDHQHQDFDIIEILQERIKAAFFTAFNNHEIVNSETLGKIQASMLRDHLIEELYKKAPWQVIGTSQDHTDAGLLSRNGRFFVTVSDNDNTAKIWCTRTGELMHTLQGHTAPVAQIIFNQDDQLLVTVSFDESTKVWCTRTGVCLHTLQNHADPIHSVSCNSDGILFAAVPLYETATRIWDITGACVRTLQGNTSKGSQAVFSPDGTLIIIVSDDNTAKIWNVNTGECVSTLQGNPHSIASIAFSPDGRFIGTSSSDYTASLWNTKTGACLQTLQGHTFFLKSVAFGFDGQLVVTASDDRTVRLWDARTGICLNSLQTNGDWLASAQLSSDGVLLAQGRWGNDNVKMWQNYFKAAGIDTSEQAKTLSILDAMHVCKTGQKSPAMLEKEAKKWRATLLGLMNAYRPQLLHPLNLPKYCEIKK